MQVVGFALNLTFREREIEREREKRGRERERESSFKIKVVQCNTCLSLSALTLENLAGDFYVPGTNLAKNDKGRWPEILVSQLQPSVS